MKSVGLSILFGSFAPDRSSVMCKLKFLIGCLLIVCGVMRVEGVAGSKPNIIFVLADDLGYGDIGRFGQKIIKTPNLDPIAKEGMRVREKTPGFSSGYYCRLDFHRHNWEW